MSDKKTLVEGLIFGGAAAKSAHSARKFRRDNDERRQGYRSWSYSPNTREQHVEEEGPQRRRKRRWF